MKINKISYQDNELKWGFDSICLSNLVLLVGISGVGKTQILKSIRHLREIANGSSKNGVVWDVEFTTTSNDCYHWSGEFETKYLFTVDELNDDSFISENEDVDETAKSKILRETLVKNGNIFIERKIDSIKLRGETTPKLKSYVSVLSSLSEDDDIAPLRNEFRRIHYSDQTNSVDASNDFPLKQRHRKYKSLEEIQKANLLIPLKLQILYD